MSVATRTLQGITCLNMFAAAMGTKSVVTVEVNRSSDYIQADRADELLSE